MFSPLYDRSPQARDRDAAERHYLAIENEKLSGRMTSKPGECARIMSRRGFISWQAAAEVLGDGKLLDHLVNCREIASQKWGSTVYFFAQDVIRNAAEIRKAEAYRRTNPHVSTRNFGVSDWR